MHYGVWALFCADRMMYEPWEGDGHIRQEGADGIRGGFRSTGQRDETISFPLEFQKVL